MNEPFIITVSYQGMEHEFKARFERWGYTHRIAVLIDELTFNFEPDEEGGYRALVNSFYLQMLEAAAEKLGQLCNNSL
jgi:hypothetical protein